jgi:hypothetical protein
MIVARIAEYQKAAIGGNSRIKPRKRWAVPEKV